MTTILQKTEKDTNKMKTIRLYIDYLNKDKQYSKDRIYFDTLNDAILWGRDNIHNFNMDLIHYEQ